MPTTYPARVVEAFDRFWAAYPSRPVNPRAPALAVFAKLVREGEDPEVLVSAAGRYAAIVKAEDIEAKFIPHARRWLLQRFFDDYRQPDVPAPAGSAQPAPEHPMDWARPHVSAAAWTSWFSRLTATPPPQGEVAAWVITAPTAFTLGRVQQEYSHLIRRQFGAVEWRVEGKEP